jgi:hypothetical protein
MSSILNLLALELENMIKNGQSSIVLSDQSVEFLKKMNLPFLSEVDSNLTPKAKIFSQSVYPKNALRLIQEGDKAFKYNWLRNKVLNCPICQQHVRPGKK